MTFYQDLLERVIKTFAQAAIAAFAVAASGIVDFGSGEAWKAAAFAGIAAGLSALSSLASRPMGHYKDSASVI